MATSSKELVERFEIAARAYQREGSRQLYAGYEYAKRELLAMLPKEPPEHESARAHLCNALTVIDLKALEWRAMDASWPLRIGDVLMQFDAVRSRITRAVVELDLGNIGGRA